MRACQHRDSPTACREGDPDAERFVVAVFRGTTKGGDPDAKRFVVAGGGQTFWHPGLLLSHRWAISYLNSQREIGNKFTTRNFFFAAT